MNLIPEFCKDDLEYLAIIEDLLGCDRLVQMNDIVHHYHSTRLRHSFYVSYVSYKIAKNRGWNSQAVARAGLLHDFFLENRQEIADMNEGSHSEVHPKIALKNARQLTELTELEEDIILSHMFMTCMKSPRPRFRESWIVSMMDKYCAINEFLTPAHRWTQQLSQKMLQLLALQ